MSADKGLNVIDDVGTPAAFSWRFFRWRPYWYQEQVLDAILVRGKNRIAWVAGRRVGKTETIANAALQLAVTKPGTQIAVFGPKQKQASILSRKIKHMLAGSPFARKVVVDNVSELRLRFGTDAHGKPRDSVIFANSMDGQVRGEGADVLIVDESAYCKPEDYRSKALPFVIDRPEGIIIHISTVRREEDHFMEALREFPKHPQGQVFRTPTRLRPGITEERMAEWRKHTLLSEFMREYECVLIPDGGVFGKQDLAKCLKRYALLDLGGLASLQPKRHHAYYVGVDWAKKQDRAVIAVVEQGSQEKNNPARLVLLQAYEPDPDNANHYTRVLDDVVRTAEHFGAHRIVADEGEGGFQAELLRRRFGARFIPYRFHTKSRNLLVEKLRYLVERGALELPLENEPILKAFANVHTTDSGYGHADRRGKDLLDAIALAVSEVGDAEVAERRRSMEILAVRAASAPIGLGGYAPMQNAEQRDDYWVPDEVRRLLG